jgi:hypothetical protein
VLIKIKVPSNKHQTLPENTCTKAFTSPPIASLSTGPILSIDKLSITLTPATQQEAIAINALVYGWLNETEVFQQAAKANGFSLSKMIALPSTAERVRFDYRREGSEARCCRFEMNPSKIGAIGLFDLHARTPLPGGWNYVVQRGGITRIDVAVDIPEMTMDDFLFMAAQGVTTKMWSQSGHLQTVQLGKPKGNSTVIYSKDQEQIAKGKPFFGPPTVRVERRLRHPAKKWLYQLPLLENPFAAATLTVSLPGTPPGEKMNQWIMFMDSVRVRGLTAALALLPQERRTRYRKWLKSQGHPVWDTDAIWSNWPKLLSDLKLLANYI